MRQTWKYNRPRNTSCDCSEETETKTEKQTTSPLQHHNSVLYFYKQIEPETIADLSQKLVEMSSQMKIAQINFNLPHPPPIHLHVHSDGGDLLSGLAMSDKIAASSVPIYTYAEGLVASAATLLTVVGTKRYMYRNSCMLIHQLSSLMWGNYEKLKDESTNTDLLMSFIRNIYKKHTKMSDNLINEILKHDLYLSSDICLEYGLIDKIL